MIYHRYTKSYYLLYNLDTRLVLLLIERIYQPYCRLSHRITTHTVLIDLILIMIAFLLIER